MKAVTEQPSVLMAGLVLQADVSLSGGHVPPPDRAVDLRIRAGDVWAGHRPLGDPVALHAAQGAVVLDVRRAKGELRVWLRDTASFVVVPEQRSVTYGLAPNVAPDLAGIFMAGLVLSSYLLAEGQMVLHASAVHVRELGGAVAFVGSSGMGKSTMATLLALRGGLLITDDVLRVDEAGDTIVCRRGPAEARLREKAASLAAGQSGAWTTADGRTSLPLPRATEDVPLIAIVIPGPVQNQDRVLLRRLSSVQGLLALTSHPRVPGWCDPKTTAQHFARTSDLVRRVPVYASLLPWGPPFDPSMAEQVVAALLRG